MRALSAGVVGQTTEYLIGHFLEVTGSGGDHAVRHFALPFGLCWTELLGRLIEVRAMEDNEPCIQAIRRGVSRKLAYVLAKKEKVSVSALHELFVGDPDEPEATTPHRVRRRTRRTSRTCEF